MQTTLSFAKRCSPFSTGHFFRSCRVCGTEFSGLGVLCPKHLAQRARERAVELAAARAQSQAVIAERERKALRPRTEWVDELDVVCMSLTQTG